jgi:hypothetical protein
VSGMVDELCSFLAATGTKVIYGVNFKSDNVTALGSGGGLRSGKCGSSIIGFEIGNEINRYQGSWASLQAEWESFATAITPPRGLIWSARLPAAEMLCRSRLRLPQDESAKFGSKLVLLTQHYYAGTAGTSTRRWPPPDSGSRLSRPRKTGSSAPTRR